MNIPVSPSILSPFLAEFPKLSTQSQAIYKRMILRFDRWLEQKSAPHISEQLISQWLEERSKSTNEHTLGFESGILLKFFDYLCKAGLSQDNLFKNLLDRYPLNGWRGIARSFHNRGSDIDLDFLKKNEPFSGPLGNYFREFIQWKKSLGKKYESERGVLCSFESWLYQSKIINLGDISFRHIEEWLSREKNKNAYTMRMRVNLLIQFFNFLTLQRQISNNPALPLKFQSKRRFKPPTILSPDQIRMILEEAERLEDSPLFPYRGRTYSTLFLTLYALGLRISEGLRLQLKDINWQDQAINITLTKFFKSRLLPMGDKFSKTLKAYVTDHPLINSRKADSYLFSPFSGRPLSRSLVGQIFHKIWPSLPIPIIPGHRTPCLHSLRHSFAVHRLLRWYKEGADVQQKLPLLSAYLGHKDITSTQVYLEITWELLESAQNLFYTRFGKSFVEAYHEDKS